MRKNIRRVLLLVFLAGALFTGWKYCEETAPDMASEKWYEAARQAGSAENTETAGGQGPWEPLPDFDALRASCPDIQAWIRNPGTQLDYPVVQGCVLVFAIFVMVINLLVDVCYKWIDPRITLD